MRKSTSRRGRRALAISVAVFAAIVGVASAAVDFNPFGNSQVGSSVGNSVLLPTNQWISPLGDRILDDSARLVSSTISPDGHYLAALGWNEFSGYVTIIDLTTHAIVQQVGLATGSGSPQDFSVAADGPLYCPDGTTLWVPQSTYLTRFSVDPSTGMITQTAEIPLCGSDLTSPSCDPNIGPSNASGSYLPSGMALSPDGSKLYVALNGANTLGVIDTATNTLISRSRSATPRARWSSPATAPPPTCPTRAVVRPTRRLHQPLRWHPDRLERRDRRRDQRHRLGGEPRRPARRRRRSRSACSRPRCIRPARACSSPTPTTTACR